ncbi:hypothetical protein V8C44DRAFT_2042 [Trichoderma aethiopicum]
MRAPVWTLPRPMYLILLTSLLHLPAFVITITCSHPSPDMLAVVSLVAAVAGRHFPRYHPRTRPFLATGCRRHQDPVPMRGDIKRWFPYCNGRHAWLLPPHAMTDLAGFCTPCKHACVCLAFYSCLFLFLRVAITIWRLLQGYPPISLQVLRSLSCNVAS